MLSPLSAGAQRALIAFRQQSQAWSQAAERLSTGLRINRAADDPAGLVAATNLQQELANLNGQLDTLAAEDHRARIDDALLASSQTALTNLRDLVGAAAGEVDEIQIGVLQGEVDLAIDGIERLESYGRGFGLSAALAQLRSGGRSSLENDLTAAGHSIEAAASMVARRRALLGAYQRNQIEPQTRLTEDQIVLKAQTLSELQDTDFAVEFARLNQSATLMRTSLLAIAIHKRQADGSWWHDR
jgi:flagellin-like hook-associated protein FlgL